MDDEILDLVDECDVVIGRLPRADVHARGLHNFRGVAGFVRNARGELLVMRRQMNKKILPGCLDASVTGHVASGETYDQAIARELTEELGLSLETVRWRRLGHLTPQGHGSYCFYNIYEFAAEDTPPYNRGDFSAHYWLSLPAVKAWLKRGEPASSALSVSVREFYS